MKDLFHVLTSYRKFVIVLFPIRNFVFAKNCSQESKKFDSASDFLTPQCQQRIFLFLPNLGKKRTLMLLYLFVQM